jgi:hypothetical protein
MLIIKNNGAVYNQKGVWPITARKSAPLDNAKQKTGVFGTPKIIRLFCVV